MNAPFPVRRPTFDFSAVPRWWWGGDPAATHLANGLCFVFPAGERFFIRSVRHFEEALTDPALRARVRAFYGQEAQHQRAHREVFARLEAQGFEIKSFLDWYEETGYRVIEPRTPPVMRLATTVALEHFTAVFGAWALTDPALDAAHPAMAALLRWHAAEEIEHKSVAFDVLRAVDGRYRVRLAGFLLAVSVLVYFWAVGTRHLLRQEASESKKAKDVRGLRALGQASRFAGQGGLVPAVLRFLKPGFHPDQTADAHLAAAWLEGMA